MRQNMRKRKESVIRARTVCPELAAFIIYKSKRTGITQGEIAVRAGVSSAMVHQVIWGKKRSARVCHSIALVLGYADWSELVLGSRGVAA